MSNPTDRTRDRQNLSDLAKLATSPSMTPPPASVAVVRGAEANSDDSGIVDFSLMAAMDPGAAARAKTTELASKGLFDDAPASARALPVAVDKVPGDASAPPASSASATALASPSSAALPVAATLAVAAASPSPDARASNSGAKKSSMSMLFVGGGAAAAIAAGIAFFMMRGQPAAPAAPSVVSPPASTVVAAAVPAKVETPVAPVAVEAPPPVAGSTEKSGMAKAAVPTFTGEKPVSPGVAAAPAAGGAGGAGALEFKAPTAPRGKAGDLGEEMRKSVGAETAAGMTPAATGGGAAAANLPQRPPQGQVAGAISNVSGAAKACISSDDPVVKATVVFKSDGTVQSVSAAGPGGACIKAALSKAKVQPFAEPTFSFPVTVRGAN